MTTQAQQFVPDLSAFGARLALIRWYKGWNQKEAALACGFPPASWREWELSNRAPRNLAEVAWKIYEHTGVNDYWIMTGRPAPGDPDGGGRGSVRREGIEPPTRCFQVSSTRSLFLAAA